MESIATYTGESYLNIRKVINDQVKEIIGNVIINPELIYSIDEALLKELVEMDIFTYIGEKILPNTCIFLKKDMEMLALPLEKMGRNLADIIKRSGQKLNHCSPDLRNFLGSIIGAGQGLHEVMKDAGLASTWEKKSGLYAKSKIDFNEDCSQFHKFGQDLQIKRVHKGHQYTGVVIGAGKNNYMSFLSPMNSNSQSKEKFFRNMNLYFTDLMASKIKNQDFDETFLEILKASNIDYLNRDIVITKEEGQAYESIVSDITQACKNYFFEEGNIENVFELLKSTVVGKQGVPVSNMMMNFWRFLRKTTAKHLYENGFLSDSMQKTGSITVFYENELDYFKM